MSLITDKEALEWIYDGPDARPLLDLIQRANHAREEYAGKKITMCAILNARCGNCTENCAFCAQSAKAHTGIKTWDIQSEDEILAAAKNASQHGANRFAIVTSGRSVRPGRELDIICGAIRRIRAELNILPCASLGLLTPEVFQTLKDAGLDRYHHNLEAAASYFPTICSTRNYDDQLRTVRDAKAAGLTVCSGGIFGLGESDEQRIGLLACVRSLGVDSVPVNFLNAIPGTRLEHAKPLKPTECLRILAVARLMMPSTSIRVCGGREKNLRDFQSWIFAAGAESFMTGGYLVTPGRENSKDIEMIRDAGLELWESSL